MNPDFLKLLICPKSGQALHYEEDVFSPLEVKGNFLISANGENYYPVINSIPRFVDSDNYADNFGKQWNKFRQTQLDSYSGLPITANRFWKATGWTPDDIKDKWVLDVGCGAGRFAEIALQAGANVIALDYSSAIDACQSNLAQYPNLYPVQGDIYHLPFKTSTFGYVYSLGVLQHTPDVANAFKALPPLVCPEGKLCVDYYWKRIRTILHAKYLVRPITKRMNNDYLLGFLEKNIASMLKTSQVIGSLPLLGKIFKRIIPVADYTGRYPLSEKQLLEWALLDTFDMLAPEYDNPQSASTAKQWFEEAGFADIEIFQEGHLVARGKKP